MLILTPKQIRQAEHEANAKGLPFDVMMENAGKGCADHICRNYTPCKTAVLCGSGKNGGDGYVIARHLAQAGFSVSVFNVGNGNDALSAQMRAKMPCTAAQDTNEALSAFSLIVDAIFGIGFHGELPQNIKDVITQANNSSAVRIAVDIPSGLCTESSEEDLCFAADETLTMLCYKPIHAMKPHCKRCGKITVIPIGFTTDEIDISLQTMFLSTPQKIAALLPKRPWNAHKGTSGNTLLVCGSYKMPGAAAMAAKGALSSGAGLVSLAFPDAAYSAIAPQLPECLLLPLKSDAAGALAADNAAFFAEHCNRFASIAFGCGATQEQGAESCLLAILENYEGKMLIDADGINILSRHIDILNRTKADILITPHPGEMSHLTGKSIADINADRANTAKEFAAAHNCVTLLKGADTVISTPDGIAYINPTGNPAMARGGSGDLLTGIIAALLAQGLSVCDAAVAGAYLHGLCGDIAAAQYTEFASTIARITDCLPDAFARLLQKKD